MISTSATWLRFSLTTIEALPGFGLKMYGPHNINYCISELSLSREHSTISGTVGTNNQVATAPRRLENLRNTLGTGVGELAKPNNASDVISCDRHHEANRSQMNLVYFLQRSSNLFPDKVAVKMDELIYTYTEFLERVHCLGYALRAEGAQPGDRVACISPNIPALFEGYFGVPCLRAIIEAINYRLKASEIEYILDRSGSKLRFVDYESYDLVAHLADPLRNIRVHSSDPYEQFLAKGRSSNCGWKELSLLGNENDTLLTSESAMMCALPLFHCNEWIFPWAMAVIGRTNVMVKKIDYSYIRKVLATKAMVRGSPPSSNLIGRVKLLNLIPVHMCESTETYGPSVVSRWKPEWKSLTEHEQAIDVPFDDQTPGEVVTHGAMVMKGCYNDPAATEEAFKGDGYIQLRDCRKDIISGGENTRATIEVEQINEHPAALDIAVAQVTEDETISFCKKSMAGYKYPVEVVQDFSKTSTGKIQKFALRAKECERHGISAASALVTMWYCEKLELPSIDTTWRDFF
ncbi:acetyl-CoA synthetase-like protein [Basidiobolus meristosporus CBS 931.73]|uniref:Acetyl-CoA synthetase-like protein n=1 Tax=Basidiobolus meristosporus CBS 931.73 TaxID=1314790 RepID=A0A1Y1YZ15_9FUNG|nr:acetyl-CoA synthetase-like protein [Basidiobolus meristosporus CBS 931.73]|eukprot:ORY03283.1 acetyl-CoA synthetase-like protein [Basidiobolus meristosporus CBS 931.73]